MKCKYYTVKYYNVNGGSPLRVTEYLCLLKMRDSQMKIKVCTALFNNGLQGSMFTDDCPVAVSNRWTECPFYEEEE